MLKFFRHIRQNLLFKGNLRKYLVYGLGEILLVVIGILIALQINNWNASLAKQKEEIKILKELNNELEKRQLSFKRNLAVQKRSYQSILLITDHIEQNRPYHDSLDQHFGMAFEVINTWVEEAAFENLKTKGIDLISNDSLRRKIISIYDSDYDIIQNLEKGIWIEYRFLNEYCLGLFDKASVWEKTEKGQWRHGTMKPLDFEALKRDQKFLSILKTLKSQTQFNTEILYPQFVKNMVTVNMSIQQEIKSMD